jgi:hypothetical protein
MRCPFCTYVEWVSEEDPDASFSMLLNHVVRRHPHEDQSPPVLWPKIEVSG